MLRFKSHVEHCPSIKPMSVACWSVEGDQTRCGVHRTMAACFFTQVLFSALSGVASVTAIWWEDSQPRQCRPSGKGDWWANAGGAGPSFTQPYLWNREVLFDQISQCPMLHHPRTARNQRRSPNVDLTYVHPLWHWNSLHVTYAL